MSTEYEVKNRNLAPKGKLMIEWAEAHMPVLMKIRAVFQKEKPLKGIQIASCLHVTKETAVLVKTLKAGGAEVALCGSNPLSTQDEVAAALTYDKINVYAWRGETEKEYQRCIDKTLTYNPVILMDDGADLISTSHKKGIVKGITGASEETTTGITRLRSMEQEGALKYPIIAVNDAYTKYLFDNRFGTGQSTIDGIIRATSILLAGKNFVVCGYGWCGRGIAMRARGMGANVIVTEVNPIKALEAAMDGFTVMSIDRAAKVGDIFVTVTGDTSVIRKEHMLKMKDSAILANSGHFNVEISIPDLEAISKSKRTIRQNVQEYMLKDGRRLYLLAEGRLVNLVAAEGHPPEVMMMSFANQALSAEYLVKYGKELEPKIYKVPEEIDQKVATLALSAMGIQIDKLTEEQVRYLKSWELGTT
ncbi:MAG: adenosylhomocysteinase [Euryarchaeota archaeon]|nr:adenosylhomocysteinase [Euryarchaeota archaeon]